MVSPGVWKFKRKVGDNIERVLVLQSKGENSGFFDEIMEIVKRHPELDFLYLNYESVLSLHGLEIDRTHRQVCYNNQKISLTAKEYGILCLLVANRGKILTYNQIYQKVWGEEAFGGANNAIACHIHNLREKLGMDSEKASFAIRCIREVGYCFEEKSEERSVT